MKPMKDLNKTTISVGILALQDALLSFVKITFFKAEENIGEHFYFTCIAIRSHRLVETITFKF